MKADDDLRLVDPLQGLAHEPAPSEAPPPSGYEWGYDSSSSTQFEFPVWGKPPDGFEWGVETAPDQHLAAADELELSSAGAPGTPWDSEAEDSFEAQELPSNANALAPNVLKKALAIAQRKGDKAAVAKIQVRLEQEARRKEEESIARDAEMMQLIFRVQRMKALLEARKSAEMPYHRGDSDEEWARAAGVTPGELRAQLAEGEAASDALVNKGMWIVGQVVYRLKRQYSRLATPEADLMQEGCMALLRSVELFQPSHGVRFTTFAWRSVERKLYRVLHEQSRVVRVPEHVHSKYRKIKHAKHVLGVENGIHVPSDREICRVLHASGHDLSPYQVRTAVQAIEVNANTLSLDQEFEAGPLTHKVGTNREVELVELHMMRTAFRDQFEELMNEVLAPDQADFLRLRFGLDQADGPRTVHEAGKLLGLEPGPAKAAYVRALRKIRKHMVSHGAYKDYTHALA
jgi:RNA polymerase primary sigma factor